ncbi:MAG: hypothetical protein KY468_10680 [Armatimonadetes bacterium]|nr:hypothetical protein [Armatimonadota bacterium]
MKPQGARAQEIGSITTVAGTGEFLPPGEAADNFVVGTFARLVAPRGMAVGARGGIFFADGNLIRKYNPATKILSTVAGSPAAGFAGDGGRAEEARFFNPRDVETDAAGNVYVADTGNFRIRKIAYDGTVSTLAGTGVSGIEGDAGPATAAQLLQPTALALDAQGNLYIADGPLLRKIDAATNVLTTVAGHLEAPKEPFYGSGPALEARIGRIGGLAVDTAGNIYLTAQDLGLIYLVSNDPKDKTKYILQWIAGDASVTGLQETVDSSRVNFEYPTGITIDARGDLYIADAFQHRIRRLDARESQVTTLAGSGPVGQNAGSYGGDDASARLARFNGPWDVVMHPSGDLYVSDTRNARLRMIDQFSGEPLYNGQPFPLNGLEYGESTTLPRPENDNIQNATALLAPAGQITGSTVGATAQAPFLAEADKEPEHGYAAPRHSIWYQWTPTVEGRVTFDTLGSGFDTRISVYSGSLAGLERVASNDDARGTLGGGTYSRVDFMTRAEPGEIYFIAVDGYDGASGNVTLNWRTDGLFPPTAGPHITALEPPLIPAGSEAAAVMVKGVNFFGSPSVLVNGVPRPTTKRDEQTLEVQIPKEDLARPGAVWLRVSIGPEILSNLYALDVYRMGVVISPTGGILRVETPVGQKSVPGVSTTVHCAGETGCIAAPAVSNLAEAVNLPSIPGKPVSDSLYMNGVTSASRATVQITPAIGLPAGTRLVALTGGPISPMPGIVLPALSAGSLSGTPEAGSPQVEEPVQWRFVKGSEGIAPDFLSTQNPDGSATVTGVQVTLDPTSVPRVSELPLTVFALVELVYGDLNFNGRIEVEDAVLALQSSVGVRTLTDLQLEVGDVAPAPGTGPRAELPFGDGMVDVADVVWLLRTAVGLQ